MTKADLKKIINLISSSKISEYRKKSLIEKLNDFINGLDKYEFELSDIKKSFPDNSDVFLALDLIMTDSINSNISSIENYDIAIICALESELCQVIKMYNSNSELKIKNSKYIFNSGLITTPHKKSIKTISAFTNKMGFVDTTQLTSELIIRFNPKYIIMTGVCGGRKSQGVNIGDIILPQNIFAYQFGKDTVNGFEHDMVNESTDDHIIQVSKKIALEVTRKIFDSWNGEKDRQIKLSNESLASGTAVINKLDMLEREISKQDRKLVAVDMESYAVMRAARLLSKFNVEPIVIKSVMDFTEHKDRISNKSYASFTSTSFMYFLLDYLDI